MQRAGVDTSSAGVAMIARDMRVAVEKVIRAVREQPLSVARAMPMCHSDALSGEDNFAAQFQAFAVDFAHGSTQGIFTIIIVVAEHEVTGNSVEFMDDIGIGVIAAVDQMFALHRSEQSNGCRGPVKPVMCIRDDSDEHWQVWPVDS